MVLLKETHLNLVFEHVEQDLAAYIDDCPPPGISEWKAKVCNIFALQHFTSLFIKLVLS